MSRQGMFWICLHFFWFLHRAESNNSLGRPVVQVTPQTPVEGTLVSLACSTSRTPLPVGDRPALLYKWRRNGVDIYMTGPPERHTVLGASGQILEISRVHHTDTTYTCTASENGTQLTSEETAVTLDVMHGPYNLKTNPGKPSARENEALEITASADCNPACNYTWSIGDDVISQGPLLKFETFQSGNASNYTALAANTYGTADLTVEVTLNTNKDEHTIPGEFWTTDGGVTSSGAASSPFEQSYIVIGASAAAGGLVLLIIIIVIAVCCARRRRKKKDDASVEDLVANGSTSASDTRGFANEAVAADQGNTLYHEENKTQKGKKDKTENDAANGGPEPVLYTQVDKNRPRNGKDKAKGNGQREVPDELTVPVPSHYDDVEGASAPHPDHVTSVAEDPYTDVASAGHAYSNTEQGQGQALRPPKKVQGFTYSELTFAKDSEARAEVIHSKEPPTEYSEVNFNRTAPPSN